MIDDNLIWLLKWYYGQCDSDWEHINGIAIGTLDNPGWFFKVSLDETEVEDQDFNTIEINRTDDDWLYCNLEEKMFKGYGGPLNLPEILQIFRDWVESCMKISSNQN